MQAAIPCKIKSQSTPTVYAWLLQSISLTPLVGNLKAGRAGCILPVRVPTARKGTDCQEKGCRHPRDVGVGVKKECLRLGGVQMKIREKVQGRGIRAQTKGR
jgi:hypothetical protein